jgi:hypothetical protein
MAEHYGGFSLRRQDKDESKLWGGDLRSALPPATHVRELQNDLLTLGFSLIENADGVFGRTTEWAVREFQIYAKMEFVARIDPDLKDKIPDTHDFLKLIEVKNDDRYTGPISGVVNNETAKRIKAWIDKGWRCPVIACAFELNDGTRTGIVKGKNLWLGENAHDKPARVYVRDFTRYYCQSGELPPQVQRLWIDPSVTTFRLQFGSFVTGNQISRLGLNGDKIKTELESQGGINKFQVVQFTDDIWEIRFLDKPTIGANETLIVEGITADQFQVKSLPEWVVLGDHVKYATLGGPRSIPPNHCPTEYGGELLPESLTGIIAGDVNSDPLKKSTYRVIRAVSEVECLGFFDSLNAYDNGLLSLGPCHWILGKKSGDAIAAGELGAFMSLLKKKSPTSFAKVISNFGVEVIDQWDALRGNGEKLFNKAVRTYSTWIKLQTESDFKPLQKTWREASWFKTWHWFYRFAMAGRMQFEAGVATNNELEGYRTTMWDMARIRIADILSAEWPKIDNQQQLEYVGPENPAGPAGRRNARIGDVFTSERSVALLLRWHINAPGTLLKSGKAGKHLVAIYKKAKTEVTLSETIDSSITWVATDNAQAILIKHFLERVKSPDGPLASSPQSQINLVNTLDVINAWPNQADRSVKGYQLIASNSVFKDFVAEELSTSKESFAFFSEGIDVASLVEESQTVAIPLRNIKPQDPLSTSPRFEVALLGQISSNDTISTDAIAFNLFVNEFPDILASSADVQESQAFIGFRLPVRKIVGQDLKLENLDTNPDNSYDRDFRLFNNANQLHQQDIEIRLLAEGVDLDKHEWEVDISSLADFFGLELSLKVILDQGKVHLELIIDDRKISLPRSFSWSFAANGNDLVTSQWTSLNFDIDEVTGTEVAHVKFDIENKTSPLEYDLPFLLDGVITGTLDLAFSINGGNLQFLPKLDLAVDGKVSLDLGSPLARLEITGGLKIDYNTTQGLRFILSESNALVFKLDLFEKLIGQDVVINNIWENLGVPTGDQNYLINLNIANLSGLADEAGIITWENGYPSISQELLGKIFSSGQLIINTQRRLKSLAGELLGSLLPSQVTFDKCDGSQPIEFIPEEGKIKICVRVKVSDESSTQTIFAAEGKLVFEYDRENNNAILRPGAFRCTVESLLRVKQQYHSSFSDLISLHIPKGTAFNFICDPKAPKLEYSLELSRKPPIEQNDDRKPEDIANEGTNSPIAIRIPASENYTFEKNSSPPTESEKSTFTFDLEKFAIHTAGFDLKGAIRSEQVVFEDVFEEPLALKQPEKDSENGSAIGRLEFRNSTLIQGSLQASAKLKYFDDAIGTFSLFLAQDKSSKQLDAAGTLEISGLSEFHVDRLYLACQVTLFHLGVKYINKSWAVEAWMSGRVKFTPPRGESAGNMKELSALFGGLECEFEQFNPLELGAKDIKLVFPAKRFEFANVFDVDLQGVVFQRTQNNSDRLQLLGDINIKQLPGVDASLRFGNITLIDGDPPSFTVDRIGAQFNIPGGGTLDGDFEFIEFETESGFLGAFAVTTETLPRIAGLLKLTRVLTEDRRAWVPSIAVYLEADIDAALFAGFFLRSIGVGLGIYQALSGLKRSDKRSLPQKIASLVNNPAGLPEPRRPEAWEPDPPASVGSGLNWMLVAAGLITFGKLPPDRPHPLAGSILLALDQDLQLVAAVNIWLFASPNDTRTTEFSYRPTGRGALGLSVKEKRIFAMFRTFKNPKLRDDAPPILKEVLSKVETTLLFSADRNGMLVEVGWPWETKIAGHALGEIIKGEMVSGFHFGIYQGVISFGLNYAVSIALEAERSIGFSTPLGSAEASLSAKGKGMFRASFVGAIDRSFKVYLVGDVRINASLSLTAAASVSFSKKITRWFKISISIRFKSTIQISISAALTAAMEPGPNLGFEGEAEVAISVSGYRLAGRLAFKYRPEVIQRTRNNIQRLLPPSLQQQTALRMMAASTKSVIKEGWHYRFVKSPDQKSVRVLLFPQPGTLYPAPPQEKLLSLNDTKHRLTDFDNNFSFGISSILELLDISLGDRTALVDLREILRFYLVLQPTIKAVTSIDPAILTSLGASKGWRVGSDSDLSEQDYLLIPFEEEVEPQSEIFEILNSVPTFIDALQSTDASSLKPEFEAQQKPFADPSATSIIKEREEWRIGTDTTPLDQDYVIRVVQDAAGTPTSLKVFYNPERVRTVIRVFQNPQRPRFTLTLKNPELFRGFLTGQKIESVKKIEPVDGQLFWGEELEQELTPKTVPIEEKIYLRDVLCSLDNEPDKTHFQNVQEEISDSRPLNPSSENIDDETAAISKNNLNSPNLTRDTEYDQELAQAWSNPVNTTEIHFLSFQNPEKAEQIQAIIDGLGKLSLNQDNDLNIVDTALKNLFKDTLPSKIFPTRLASTDAAVFQGNVVWKIDPSNPSKDETKANGIYIVQLNEGIRVLANNYDEAEPDERLSAGMLLAELLEFIEYQAKPREEQSELFNIADLKLVLEFNLTDDLANKPDPIPELINLEWGIAIDGQLNDGERLPLESLLGKGKEPPEYDLIAGPVHQSNEQVCLTWLFLREDIEEQQGESQALTIEDPFVAYIELEKFIIIRRNLSRLSDKPKQIDLYPSWIEKGDNRLIRPQFQFVDEELEEVNEGDQLQYEVRAKGGNNSDRVLTACLINVIRTTLEPLSSPSQALALHDLNKKNLEILEILVAVESDEKQQLAFPSTELRLRYRIVTARTVGSYGFEPRPEIQTQWSSGLPSRDQDENFSDLKIEFATAPETRPLPWIETLEISPTNWLKVENTIPENQIRKDVTSRGYYRLVLTKETLEDIGWKPSKAIEFYVGREIVESSNGQSQKRSALIKCRHAIVPKLTNTNTLQSDEIFGLDMERGNFVEAIECLPKEASAIEWFAPNRFNPYRVDYPEVAKNEEDEKDQKPVELTLTWQHDLSGRKGFDDPLIDATQEIEGFNPVIGYRLYRHDKYSIYPFSSNAEIVIRVIPDLLYRAQPDSIEVLGLADQTDRTIPRPRQPDSVDEVVSDRLKYGLKNAQQSVSPVADWIPNPERNLLKSLTVEEFTLPTPENPNPEPPSSFDRFDKHPEERPGGKVWLHKNIQQFLKEVKESFGGEYKITIADPLELKAFNPISNDEFIAAFQSLVTELNQKTDPYGWRTLESLGLACECRFTTKSGQPIKTEEVIKAINQLKDKLPSVSVGVFLADNNKTPLDVIRVVHARLLRDWTDSKRAFDLDKILSYRFRGVKVSNQHYEPEALSPELKAPLIESVKKWLTDINQRLISSLLVAETGNQASSQQIYFRYDARTSQKQVEAKNVTPKAIIRLPISTEGEIEYQLTLPDRWAHQYEIALELVRRYDRVLGKQVGAIPEEENRIIVQIDRSEPLANHNLIATPLNGSIQAIVFRHPAAFAAAASAVQAAHSQYTGQTVHLERRIDEDSVLKILKAIYDRFKEKQPALDWQKYQSWLDEKEQVNAEQSPKAYTPAGTISKPKILDPLQPVEEGKLPAVYGADRYVFPDLPGYYQYRVIAYSTAGRVHSDPKESTWVSPLYEAGEDARQRPVAEPCTVANYNRVNKSLQLQIPLIHPRQHLPESLRGLWVESDERLEIDDPAISLRYGSLPDLYLTYQVYLWVNKGVGNGANQVYIPLLAISPPNLKADSGVDNWFKLALQAPGLDETVDVELLQDNGSGQIFFSVALIFVGSQSENLLTALNALAREDVREIIPLVVQRNGVWSEIQPPPPKP